MLDFGFTEVANLSVAGVMFYFLKVIFKEYKEERNRNNEREIETIKALNALEVAINRNSDLIEKAKNDGTI